MDNAAIARILSEIADIGEIRADNAFKVRAYRNAAAAVESLPYSGRERLQEIRAWAPASRPGSASSSRRGT